jgi:alpha-L-rhamnosidase
MPDPRISKLTFGRNASPIGIQQSRPSLSWRFEQDGSSETNWKQTRYELSFIRNGKETNHKEESANNVEVPWPKDEPPLASRERATVRVRTQGGEWFSETVEAALLESTDWSASVIAPDLAPPATLSKRPFYARKTFTVHKGSSARIYATALGVYEVTVNGQRIGDHVLAPGWQSYDHRLHYQTYEVGNLVQGENVIEAVVGEGWYSGRLTWMPDCRNIWGSEIGVMIQLEVDGKTALVTDESWEWSYGPLLASELYDGETYDAGIQASNWRSTKTIPIVTTNLIAPEAPPIRRTEELKPIELIITPAGKKIIDFGQNFVGWIKIQSLPKSSRQNEAVTLRYAEVLEKKELGIRPLRSAKATDKVYLGTEELKQWEPKFTTHGFRYCEVSGPSSLFDDFAQNFVGVVVHSDMERIGDFTCSHDMVNKLHQNVVWSLRGNFVGLPTDCPQRDER